MKTKRNSQTNPLASKPRRMWMRNANGFIYDYGCDPVFTPVLVIPLTDECIKQLREKAVEAAFNAPCDGYDVDSHFRAIGLVAPASKQRKRRASK